MSGVEMTVEEGQVQQSGFVTWWDFSLPQMMCQHWLAMSDVQRYDFVMSSVVVSFLLKGKTLEDLFDTLRSYRNSMGTGEHMAMLMWLDSRETNIAHFADCLQAQHGAALDTAGWSATVEGGGLYSGQDLAGDDDAGGGRSGGPPGGAPDRGQEAILCVYERDGARIPEDSVDEYKAQGSIE